MSKITSFLKKSQIQAPMEIMFDQGSLGSRRFQLLKALDETGSISAAARKVGVSYKSAWDNLDAINNLSPFPIMQTATGGERGGGAELTDHGKELLGIYSILEEEQERFIEKMNHHMKDFQTYFKLIRRISMRMSARNQIQGKVNGIKKGNISSEVEIKTSGGDRICATVTNESVETLGIKPGTQVYGVIKATQVILSTVKVVMSARNNLKGKISKINVGPVNVEVGIELDGSTVITSIITHDAFLEMGLKEEMEVFAIFKASSVILGVE